MNFILILLVAMTLFITSNGLGKLLIGSESKFYSFRSIFGFLMQLTILQIGYYPIQFFQWTSISYQIYTLIILVLCFVIGIRKLKKEDFFFLKHWEFYVLLILIFGVIKILPTNEAGDDWFYMPLIKSNANIKVINSIQPKSGWSWNVDMLYAYQGYYLFMSFIYKIVNFFISSVDAVFISFRSSMSLLFIIFSSITFISMKGIFKLENSKCFLILMEIASILLLGALEWSHIYWGSFAIYPIFIPLCLLLMNEYVKSNDRKIIQLIVITNFGLLSLVSSALFLSGFILFSFLIYSVLKNKFQIKDYFFLALPLMIYVTFFIGYPILIIFIPILYYFLVHKKFNEIINLFVNKYGLYFLFTVPLAFFLIGIVCNLNFDWKIYRLGYSILIFNIIFASWIGYLLIKKETIEPLLIFFLIVIIFFFNPLTAPFVSRFLTSSTVYYRMFYLTKNPVIIVLLFYSVYSYLKNYYDKLLPIFGAGLVLFIGIYGYKFSIKTILEPTYKVNYNYLLREDDDSRNLGFELEKVILSSKKVPNILSIYYAPRQYVDVYSDVYRYPNDPKYEDDIVYKMLYQPNDWTQSEFIEFKHKLQKTGYDYVITFNDQTIEKKIEWFCEKFYSNETYALYRVKQEKWNKQK